MTYRAGIIGAGGIAGLGVYGGDPDDIGTDPVEASHAGGYAATDGVELVAVADIDEEQLDVFGTAWEIPKDRRYSSHEEMLRTEDLDIVSVCTPSLFHHDHVLDAVEIGEPAVIWCEKPLACSVAGGEAMVETCEAADVELLVNHSQRFLRQHQALRAAIDSDLLGEVYTAAGATSIELFRVGTHVADLLVYLLDERPATVSGYISGRNDAAGHLADRRIDDAGGGGFFLTDGDTFVTFDGDVPRDAAAWYCRLTGTDGRLVMDDRGWTWWPHDELGPAQAPTDGYTDAHPDSFALAVEHAVSLIENEADNVSSGAAALASLEILVGFFISHETGGRISVPFPEPLKDVRVTSW